MIKTLITPCKYVNHQPIADAIGKISSIDLKVPRDLEHLTILREVPYDLAFVCPDLSTELGQDLVEYLNVHWVGIRIIVFTTNNDESYLRSLMNRGVIAFIHPDGVERKIEMVIRKTMRNEYYMDPALIAGFQFESNIEQHDISRREREIIREIALGLTTSQIAEKLFISPHTVKTHRKNINSKLDIHSTSELIEFARKHHI